MLEIEQEVNQKKEQMIQDESKSNQYSFRNQCSKVKQKIKKERSRSRERNIEYPSSGQPKDDQVKQLKKNHNFQRKNERLIIEAIQIVNEIESKTKSEAQNKNLLKLKQDFCQKQGESRSTIYGYERHIRKMGPK